MEQKACNNEVSKSGSEDSESPKNDSFASRGTHISLKGEILKESDCALLVKVEYKERHFAGVLMEENNSWGPHYCSFPQNSDSDPKVTSSKNEKCLDETIKPASDSTTSLSKQAVDYHNPPQKIKNCEPRKKFETKTSSSKRFQAISGRHASICSNSPELNNSGNSLFSSNGNSVNSACVSHSDLKISSKDEKGFDETIVPASKSLTLTSKKADDNLSHSQKIKHCKSRKKFERKVPGSRRTQNKYKRFTSSAYPDCYVNECNTVPGKLRSDKNKLAVSSSSSQSSSRLDNSENIEFSSGDRDMNSASVSGCVLTRTKANFEKCLDETIKPVAESPALPCKKTVDYHSSSQKIINSKPRKRFKKKESGTRAKKKQGTLFSKYQRSYIQSDSRVKRKLRYAGYKRCTSYSPSPCCQNRVETRNSTILSSACDMDSVSVTASETPTLRFMIRIKCNNGDREIRCNAVDITETSDNSSNKFDNLELNKDSMPLISRCDVEETDKTTKENCNPVMSVESIENSNEISNLQLPHLPCLKVLNTFSDISKPIVEGITEVFEEYSAIDIIPSNSYLGEAVSLTPSCTVFEQTNENDTEVSRVYNADGDRSDSEITYSI